MKTCEKGLVIKDRSILLLAAYYLLIFLTLYLVPRWWSLCVAAFDIPFSLIANLITFVIFGGFLSILVYQEIFNKGMVDLLRYFWLIIIGWAIVATLQKCSTPLERLCIPEYALVSYITFRIAYSYTKTKAVYLWTFIVIVAFACIEETMQWFLPNRYFTVRDIYMDVWSGILTLFVIGLTLKPKLIDGLLERTSRQLLHYLHSNKEDIWLDMKNAWFEVESKVINFLFS